MRDHGKVQLFPILGVLAFLFGSALVASAAATDELSVAQFLQQSPLAGRHELVATTTTRFFGRRGIERVIYQFKPVRRPHTTLWRWFRHPPLTKRPGI
jgi:hypothetical protein